MDTPPQMLACEWRGKESVLLTHRDVPVVIDAGDAIVRVTAAGISGNDLRNYFGKGDVEEGDVLGNSAVGVVESVGAGVTSLQVGDRVVISSTLAVDSCWYCKHQLFHATEPEHGTQPGEATSLPAAGSEEAAPLRHTSTGHFSERSRGTHAEWVRVPFAEMNCLKVPPTVGDEQALLLGSVLPRAWHGCRLARVSENSKVAIWGCGPLGLLCQAWCKFLGASQVIAIDSVPYRLRYAEITLGSYPINCHKEDPVAVINTKFPGGVDSCIDCTGHRLPRSFLEQIGHALLPSSKAEENVVSQCVRSVRPSGVAVVMGSYTDGLPFPMNTFLSKGATLKGGDVMVQRYWKELLGYLESGRLNPAGLITHVLPFEIAPKAYRVVSKMEEDVLQLVLRPPVGTLTLSPETSSNILTSEKR